ncbi:MAG: hypothetical protein E7302_05750 [Butyrivibrio sp.]|nr:hypothetical protein [Butyrivibrio sp.]
MSTISHRLSALLLVLALAIPAITITVPDTGLTVMAAAENEPGSKNNPIELELDKFVKGSLPKVYIGDSEQYYFGERYYKFTVPKNTCFCPKIPKAKQLYINIYSEDHIFDETWYVINELYGLGSTDQTFILGKGTYYMRLYAPRENLTDPDFTINMFPESWYWAGSKFQKLSKAGQKTVKIEIKVPTKHKYRCYGDYIVQYATDKNFKKNAKTVKVQAKQIVWRGKKADKGTFTIKVPKKGKTYYFRIQDYAHGYKTTSLYNTQSWPVYSDKWSKTKKIKM